MTLDSRLATILTPDRQSLLFALKGILAMALALWLAMLMQLERPYWALISAVFLQIRPETGLVIEKGLCQIGGTLVGGAVGLMILAWLLPYPLLAIVCLMLWIGLNAGASAWLRQANFIYGFAMAGITATLIVVIAIANPHATSSIGIFHVATARVSEIILGATCATLVSNLFWPAHVAGLLRNHARNALNQTLAYLELELNPAGTHATRHQQVDSLLQDIFALSDDSSAVFYEGSQGPGRARAATMVCHKTLSLIARIRVIGRLMRNHDDLLTDEIRDVLTQLRQSFLRMRETHSAEQAMEEAQHLASRLQEGDRRPEPDQRPDPGTGSQPCPVPQPRDAAAPAVIETLSRLASGRRRWPAQRAGVLDCCRALGGHRQSHGDHADGHAGDVHHSVCPVTRAGPGTQAGDLHLGTGHPCQPVFRPAAAGHGQWQLPPATGGADSPPVCRTAGDQQERNARLRSGLLYSLHHSGPAG